MTDTLELAAQLRARDDGQLHELLAVRGVSPDARAEDFFDLAELLLTARSIRQIFGRLDRLGLAVVTVLSSGPRTINDITGHLHEVAPALHASAHEVGQRVHEATVLALLHDTGSGPVAYNAVSAVIGGMGAAADDALPTADALLSAEPPPLERAADGLSAQADLAASELAWGAVGAVMEIVLDLQVRPARELGRGGLSAPDAKQLAQVTQLDPAAAATHLELAANAGLISYESHGWMPTAASERWLRSPAAERWATLADGWLGSLTPQVRTMLARRPDAVWGDGLVRYAEWMYPAGDSWIRRALTRVTSQADALGVTVSGRVGTAGLALLESGSADASESLARHFPHEVDRVYLQHDLTVIAPGPLVAASDLRLRSMTHLESRAQAATYRFTPESVNRALGAGETAGTMLSFLGDLSLTGIPQPVDYLIRQAAERYGLVRVGSVGVADPEGSDQRERSYVRSDDPSIIGQIAVDQAVRALGLTRSDTNRLMSRFEHDVVFWTLSDARYPVAAEDRDGRIIQVKRRRTSRQSVAVPAPALDELIQRVRAQDTATEDGGSAWIAKQLDVAIRSKSTVVVTVAVPGSGDVTLSLEPTGMSGGRLRGRDRAADIERTLPLSSIIELRA
ncbi:hypothetical protein GCM10027416_09430 [Okibacterium endophyticum]